MSSCCSAYDYSGRSAGNGIMEIFIVLGLCFVLYEALDLFQGCYQHYHHSNNANNSLANIEKHNKSVLSRANKIIKDIIVEEQEDEDDDAEDQLCLIEEGSADQVGTSSPPTATAGASASRVTGDFSGDAERHRYHGLSHGGEEYDDEEESSILVATIVPGETTILGLRQDNNNNRQDDGLISPTRITSGSASGSRLGSQAALSADRERKERLLLKMELLNENSSSLLRPHHNHANNKKKTTTNNNNNHHHSQTIGDNENHFATNYNCRSGGVDCATKNLNNSGDRFIDSSVGASLAEYEKNVNMIRVFSVSECVQ